jgi:hypothetical protein
MGRTVVLIVIGLVVIALGPHYQRRHRPPRGAESLQGRVVDVSVKRSSSTGSAQRLHGAAVEHPDPHSGAKQVLPPDSHQPRAYHVGDEVTLIRDPATGVVRLALPRPRLQTALPFVFGGLVVALGVLDLMG